MLSARPTVLSAARVKLEAHLERHIEQGKLLERLRKEVQRQIGVMETLELERIRSNKECKNV